MINSAHDLRRLAAGVLVIIPFCDLALNALAWLRYGIDLPIADDWRQYLRGTAGSLAIQHLFKPSNDTLYPIGVALDALALRYLGGNAVAYQFLSMVFVLGSLLLLQWSLLLRVLQDRLLASACFSLTVLMLQPGSYWGLQSMAYHQALPLVCLLSVLYIVLRSRWPVVWRIPAIASLGLVSGLSYISGAFSTLAASIILLAVGLCRIPLNRRILVCDGVSLLVPGVITTALQAWVIISVQHGQVHREDAPWALPTNIDFWMYLLGKVARSLALTTGIPRLALAIAIVMTLIAVAIACWITLHLARGTLKTESEAHCAVVFLAISSVVFVYLLMVTAGRANLRPSGALSAGVFEMAFARFHFFWVTLLWPWLAACAFVLVQRSVDVELTNYLRTASLGVAGFILVFASAAGAYKHRQYYLLVTTDVLAEYEKCQEVDFAAECTPNYLPSGLRLQRAVTRARRSKATFTRIFMRSVPDLH
jgi:hypothetical protein